MDKQRWNELKDQWVYSDWGWKGKRWEWNKRLPIWRWSLKFTWVVRVSVADERDYTPWSADPKFRAVEEAFMRQEQEGGRDPERVRVPPWAEAGYMRYQRF